MSSVNTKNSKSARDKSKGKNRQDQENSKDGEPHTKEASTEPAPDVQMQNRLDGMDQGKASLDWFTFETRIRKVVFGLLSQPMETVKQMMDR